MADVKIDGESVSNVYGKKNTYGDPEITIKINFYCSDSGGVADTLQIRLPVEEWDDLIRRLSDRVEFHRKGL